MEGEPLLAGCLRQRVSQFRIHRSPPSSERPTWPVVAWIPRCQGTPSLRLFAPDCLTDCLFCGFGRLLAVLGEQKKGRFPREIGVAYGGRTRNLRIHSPLLCRLS